MPTNQYVTWATGVGANIFVTPAAYAAATIRQLGAQIGIGDPVSFNNAMRQASVVATMIAQFTADNQPGNVADDGNVATLEAEFIAALQNLIAANLIARTTKAKIAIIGRALPLVNNPINIAEEFAMLDNLSRGRIITGFVRGIGNE